MAEKRYYWFKFMEDFFEDPRIKKLRSAAGGSEYIIMYQRLACLSLKTEGYLRFDHLEDTFEEEMALILGEELSDIKYLLDYLIKHHLMESGFVDGEEMFFLPEISRCIGSETEAANRMRKLRERQKKHELQGGVKQLSYDEIMEME